jgi:ubiquinone/menaquinone biosynthesis C-methylase UbiE
MLDLAQRLAPELFWTEGTAVALPFCDEVFNAVVCQQGLPFFSDQPKTYQLPPI